MRSDIIKKRRRISESGFTKTATIDIINCTKQHPCKGCCFYVEETLSVIYKNKTILKIERNNQKYIDK
ncbi:hypothetical protein K290105B7_27350 [Anaerostipes caccae]